MTDPLRVYADLYHQALECRRRVELLHGMLLRAAEALDNRPERFRFDGLDDIAMPRMMGEAFAAAADWPTAAQIQQVLSDWHAAAARLTAAWDALWPRDRELLARSAPETANIPRWVEPARRARQPGRPA